MGGFDEVKEADTRRQGLGNKNSKLGVGQKLLEEIDAGRPKRVLLLFGHVDLFIVYLW